MTSYKSPVTKYAEQRRKDPLLPARLAWRIAKTISKPDGWEGECPEWRKTIDGIEVTVKWDAESIYPEPNRKGETDFGRYVDEDRKSYWYESDNGRWPRPVEDAPLGLPYTTIRYSGPGWVQSEGNGYFIPDGIKEQFDYYRRGGQSKSVAWDLTKQWVEDTLARLFGGPLENGAVTVTASKADVELASTTIGTNVIYDEDPDYPLTCAIENGLIEDVIEEARDKIRELIEDPRYGHCDTCGDPCNAHGCMNDPDHIAAIDPFERTIA